MTRRQILNDVGCWLTDHDALEDMVDTRRPFRLQSVASEIVGSWGRSALGEVLRASGL